MTEDGQVFDQKKAEYELRSKESTRRGQEESELHAEKVAWLRLLRTSGLKQLATKMCWFILVAHYMTILLVAMIAAAYGNQPVFGMAFALCLGMPLLMFGVVSISAVVAVSVVKRSQDVE
jgi:hypothetical protein